MMRMIEAVMERGNSKCVIKGHITNDIHNYKHEVIGYEISLGEGNLKNILIKDFKISIKEVSVL